MGRDAANEVTTVSLTGDVSQGGAIDRSSAGERMVIPLSKIDVGEIVFRAASQIPGFEIEIGDLLLVEPRNTASTAELIVVTVDDRVFIGRWWKKRGRRALVDGDLATITEGKAALIVGAITLIVRPTTQETRPAKR